MFDDIQLAFKKIFKMAKTPGLNCKNYKANKSLPEALSRILLEPPHLSSRQIIYNN